MTAPENTASKFLCERVAALRRAHRLTLSQLAEISGVSRSMLSQIERGSANPTLAVTHRIARAFDISIGELVDDLEATTPIERSCGKDPNMLFRRDEQCSIRTLSPLHQEKTTEFYEIVLRPGGQLNSPAHHEGTRELFTVVTGSATVRAGLNHCHLATGDTAHYRADTVHCIENGGDDVMRGFLVVTYTA